MNIRKKHSAVFTNLLLVYLVSLIIIIMFSLLIFSSMRSSIEKEMLDRAKYTGNYAVSKIDSLLSSTFDLNVSLTEGGQYSIISFLTLPREEEEDPISYWMTVRSILQEMKNAFGYNDEVENVTLYYPTKGVYISMKNGLHELDHQTLPRLIANYRSQNQLLTWNDGKLQVFYPFPIAQSDSGIKILICVTLSTEQLQKMLESYRITDGCELLMTRGQGGQILCATQPIPDDILKDVRGEAGKSHDGRYAIVRSLSESSELEIIQMIPYNVFFQRSDSFTRIFSIFVLLSIPLLLMTIYAVNRLVKRPMDAMRTAFSDIRGGNLNPQIHLRTSSEFQSMIDDFNQMGTKLQETVTQLSQARVYSREMEFKQLQSQINPHFLYNGFYILKHQIQSHDWEAAEEMSGHLAEYFRYITRTANQEVMLKDEWQHCRDYLSIQETRFGFRLQIEQYPLPEECSDIVVPRLILQPLLENALNYGVNTQPGHAVVKMHCRMEKGTAIITVEDNGTGINDQEIEKLQQRLDDQESETTALINIHRRLRLKYGNDYGLQVSKSALGGLLVSMSIPVRENIEGVNHT